MTVKERKKQLRARFIYFILFTVDIILFAMVFHKYTYACAGCQPVSGLTANLVDLQFEAFDSESEITVSEEEVNVVATSEEEPEIDTSCWKLYSAPRFRKLGRVKYGMFTYTWYSEFVLPGGGLDIPGRHVEEIDGLNFVCDGDGFIVAASDDIPKGVGRLIETPVGRMAKIYDCGSGKGNIDLYVSW